MGILSLNVPTSLLRICNDLFQPHCLGLRSFTLPSDKIVFIIAHSFLGLPVLVIQLLGDTGTRNRSSAPSASVFQGQRSCDSRLLGKRQPETPPSLRTHVCSILEPSRLARMRGVWDRKWSRTPTLLQLQIHLMCRVVGGG